MRQAASWSRPHEQDICRTRSPFKVSVTYSLSNAKPEIKFEQMSRRSKNYLSIFQILVTGGPGKVAAHIPSIDFALFLPFISSYDNWHRKLKEARKVGTRVSSSSHALENIPIVFAKLGPSLRNFSFALVSALSCKPSAMVVTRKCIMNYTLWVSWQKGKRLSTSPCSQVRKSHCLHRHWQLSVLPHQPRSSSVFYMKIKKPGSSRSQPRGFLCSLRRKENRRR